MSRRPTHRLLLLAVVLLAAFIPAAAGAVNSCGQLTYESDASVLSGKVWKCSVTENQFTEDEINIELDADEIHRLTGETISSDTATVTIRTDSLRNVASYDYNVKPRMATVRTYRPVDGELGGLYDAPSESEIDSWVWSNCADFDSDGSIEYNRVDDLWSSAVHLYCVDRGEQYGVAANIVDAEVLVATEFTISTPNGEVTKTVSNDGTGDGVSTEFGTFAFIRWNGNLRSGETVPDPGRYGVIGLHDNSFDSGWRNVHASNYESYVAYREDQLRNDLNEWTSGSMSRSRFAAEMDDAAEQVLEPYNEFDSPFATTNVNIVDSSLASGGFEIVLDDTVSYPNFDVFINAEGPLSVEVPVGEPRIVGMESFKFAEGDSGIVSVEVENVGSDRGGFTVDLSCGDGFRYGGTVKELSLAEGETATVEFSITGTSTSTSSREVSDSCTATMEETTIGATATDSVPVTMVQQGECSPGNRIAVKEAGQTVIKECSSDGLRYEAVERCKEDEQAEVVGGTLQCADDGGGDDGFLAWLVDGVRQFLADLGLAVGNPFGNPLLLVDVILALVAGVAMLVFGSTTLLDLLPVQQFAGLIPLGEAGFRLVVGLVLGILTAVFVYSLVSSIVVKLVLIAAIGVAAWIKGLVPGV